MSCSLWLLLCLLKICVALTTTSSSHNDRKIITSHHSIQGSEWREYCPGCRRPQPQCLCDHIPREKIHLQTRVLILQHPVEFRRRTISTVPLLRLVLEHCRVLVGRSFDVQLEGIIDDARADGRLPLLLFPGPNAIVLEDPDAMDQLARPPISDGNTQPGKYLLIIVDGTWTQAKRMLRNSPVLLERCHPIQFTGTLDRSIYDSIRKQPDTFCLSTLESCERTLKLLEPNDIRMNEASHYLMKSLKAMILTQMKYERMHMEKNPDLIRNVSKLKAKKERQRQLLAGFDGASDRNLTLPGGYTLRPLFASDAKYVDSRWPFRSSKSLVMIEKQILADIANSTKFRSSTCLGIEFDGELVACIIRHRNGSVGILHVDEGHRRLGLAEALLHAATKAIMMRDEGLFAFIVDGNNASEELFAKLGWEKMNPLGKKGTGKRKAKRLWTYSPKDADVY